MVVQIECGKLKCDHCGHELWLGLIYTKEQFLAMKCSECGNNYIDESKLIEKEKKDGNDDATQTDSTEEQDA